MTTDACMSDELIFSISDEYHIKESHLTPRIPHITVVIIIIIIIMICDAPHSVSQQLIHAFGHHPCVNVVVQGSEETYTHTQATIYIKHSATHKCEMRHREEDLFVSSP